MVNFIEGELNGKDAKIGIIVGRFNDFITSRLVDGAINALLRHSVTENDIDVVKVPGAFEVFQAGKRMIQNKKYNALICMGAIIRGETSHFDYIAAESSKGVAMLAQETSIPILFGILTTDNLEQAIERAGGKMGNKGTEVAVAAIEMINIFKKI